MNVHHRSRATLGRRLFAFAFVATTVATIAARPYAPGISFRVRIVIQPPEIPGAPPQAEMVLAGHGVAVSGRSRLDFDTVPAPLQAAGAMATGDYMLSLDSGRVVVVTPSSKSYAEGVPGMGALPPELLAQAVFTNVNVALETLGAGEPIQGFPTQRYKITTSYGLAIMGQSLNTSTVQEIWTAPLGATVATPMDGTLPKAMSEGPMKELYDKMAAARKGLGTGTAVKSIITTSITGPMNVTTTQRLDLLDLKQADIDESLLKVPEGFTRRP